MTTSLHGGHSGNYCDHAKGNLEDIIKKALGLSFTHYGLSEHMPRFQTEYLYPEEVTNNRTPEDLLEKFSAYFAEARRLREKYKDKIKIMIGMETEPILNNYSELRRLKDLFKPDYVVGSVHFIYDIPFDLNEQEFKKAEEFFGGTEQVFIAYFDIQYDLMKELRPEVIGHFDLPRLFRPHFPVSYSLWEKIERNLNYAIDYGALIEVNSRAFRKNLPEPFPGENIIHRILELNGKLTLGDDSHGPEEVGENFYRLLGFLEAQGAETLYGLELDEKNQLTTYSFSPGDWKNVFKPEKNLSL